MKIEHSGSSEKKLVAVIGEFGNGVFFPSCGGSVYLDSTGQKGSAVNDRLNLDTLLKSSQNRKPVYEGDTVTLKF